VKRALEKGGRGCGIITKKLKNYEVLTKKFHVRTKLMLLFIIKIWGRGRCCVV
jgi:hypothetical protein